MSDRASPEVLAILREVLQKQIAANDPPETGVTFSRLRHEGIDEDRVWRLLSAVLLQEMSVMIAENRPFDRQGYVDALGRLPELTDR